MTDSNGKKSCVSCEKYLECDTTDKNGICGEWEALRPATKFEKREMFEIPVLIEAEAIRVYDPLFDGCC